MDVKIPFFVLSFVLDHVYSTDNCFQMIRYVMNSQKELCETKSHVKLGQVEKLESRLKELEKKPEIKLSQVERLESRLNELEKNQAALKQDFASFKQGGHGQRVIAFSAQVSPIYENLDPGQTILFSRVLLNQGNAYNNETGVFTTPASGTYLFSCTILTGKGSALELGLQLNGHYKMMMLPDNRGGGSHDTATNLVILNLVKGDQIKMTKWGKFGKAPFYIHHIWSTFSGYKLS